MEQSTFTLYLLLHCTLGVVLRCKRDEGLHGKNRNNGNFSVLKCKICFWRTRTKPLLCIRKKEGILKCIIQEDGQKKYSTSMQFSRAKNRGFPCFFSYSFYINLYGRSFHCSSVNSNQTFLQTFQSPLAFSKSIVSV